MLTHFVQHKDDNNSVVAQPLSIKHNFTIRASFWRDVANGLFYVLPRFYYEQETLNPLSKRSRESLKRWTSPPQRKIYYLYVVSCSAIVTVELIEMGFSVELNIRQKIILFQVFYIIYTSNLREGVLRAIYMSAQNLSKKYGTSFIIITNFGKKRTKNSLIHETRKTPNGRRAVKY